MSNGYRKFSTLSYIGVNIIKNRSHSNTSLYLRILSNSKIYYTGKIRQLKIICLLPLFILLFPITYICYQLRIYAVGQMAK